MTAPLGAYGLTLPDLPGSHWLAPAPSDWPTWQVGYEYRQGELLHSQIGDETAQVPLADQGMLFLDRRRRTAVVAAPKRPVDSAWPHPCLSPIAIVAAEWAGQLAFHAGSFLDSQGRVWGILGDRNFGKSSCLGWLALHDRVVFGDDLLVTDGQLGYAGPRMVDLRLEAAVHFGAGRALGEIGTRERWRVDLPDPPTAYASLAGFIDLEWSESGTTTVRLAQPLERAQLLSRARGLMVRQAHPVAWLQVLSRPVAVFSRPRRWDMASAAMTQLIEFVDHYFP